MLDTWDNVYYPLPFVIALLVWETCSLRRAPLLALSSTVLVWLNGWLSLHSAADFQAALLPRLVGAARRIPRNDALPVRPGGAVAMAATAGRTRSESGARTPAGGSVNAVPRPALSRIAAPPAMALAGSAVAAWLGLHDDDPRRRLRERGAALLRGARPRACDELSAPRARLRRLAGRARALRAASPACGAADEECRLPDGRPSLPHRRRRLGLWLVAQARAQDRSAIAIGAVLALCVVNPAHRARARTRPPGGAARRGPLRVGRAARPARRAVPAGHSARPCDRQQGVGAPGRRSRPARSPLPACGDAAVRRRRRRARARPACARRRRRLREPARVRAPRPPRRSSCRCRSSGSWASSAAPADCSKRCGTVSHPLVIAVAVPLTALAWRTAGVPAMGFA